MLVSTLYVTLDGFDFVYEKDSKYLQIVDEVERRTFTYIILDSFVTKLQYEDYTDFIDILKKSYYKGKIFAFNDFNEKPAIFYWDDMKKNMHFKEGSLHSPNNNTPAKYMHICEHESEFYLCNGDLHRSEDMPAVIRRYEDKVSYQYFINGKQRRTDPDLPSRVIADMLGNVLQEEYTDENGYIHRDNGPAMIIYNIDKTIKTSVNYTHGNLSGSRQTIDSLLGRTTYEYSVYNNYNKYIGQ